jgi:hypothetical protein
MHPFLTQFVHMAALPVVVGEGQITLQLEGLAVMVKATKVAMAEPMALVGVGVVRQTMALTPAPRLPVLEALDSHPALVVLQCNVLVAVAVVAIWL